MADFGHIRLSRKMFTADDAFWLSGEPFCPRSAWVDLLQMAAWKGYRKVVKGSVVEVQRGQLLASERFLEKRWGWSRGRVRRFLERATSLGRIGPVTDHGAAHLGSLITICNYDAYQLWRASDDTTGETADDTTDSTSRGTTDGTKEKEGRKQVKKEERVAPGGGDSRTAKSKKRTAMPAGWAPKPGRHDRIAREEGRDLQREVVAFTGKAAANGYRYIDWDQAFDNWLRSEIGRPRGLPHANGAGGAFHPADTDWQAKQRAEEAAITAWEAEVEPLLRKTAADVKREVTAAARAECAALGEDHPMYERAVRAVCLRLFGERIGKPRPGG